uniref:von Willebrand factor D and EGF domain-containing protein n=1 Tax=Magallana gigas TaxID=29159 RepID=A0A8W8J2H6_MAGGI
MDQRFKENTARNESLMLCDRYWLGNGRWVRAEGQDLLQTEPKTHEWCGTRYPIWMKETPPKFIGEEVARDACVVGLQGPCAQTLPIKIKKCVGYNVYYLTPPTSCFKAYCFRTPPTEVVQQPEVSYHFVMVEGKTAIQQLQFICSFTAKDDYYYQVVWYIEDTPVVVKDTVKKDLLRNTDLGYDDKDATKGYQKLGINIKCSVRLKVVTEGPPGPFSEISKNFFAGIEVVSTRVTIKRDEPHGYIEVKLTVPFGCPIMSDGKVENCGLDIEMNVPRDPEKCSSDIKVAKTLLSQGKNCGFRIFQNDWQRKVTLPIAFIDTPEYNLILPDSPDGAFRIGMITGQKEGSPEWSGIELQDVYVHVQIETTACNSNNGYRRQPYCVCAVAVRAGADVFVIDRCPYKPVRIKYLSCKENLLDARKLYEKVYRIYFPSGTYVDASLEDYTGVQTINVYVYPSKSDHDRTGGLCGTLNGNMLDDFMDRDGNLLRNNEAFNQHWSLREAAFLGNMNEDQLNALPRWKNDAFYCTCPYKQVSGNKPKEIRECSEDTIVKCAKEDNPALNKNKCQIRNKRSAVKLFSYKMFQRQDIKLSEFTDTEEINLSRMKREAEVNWTRERAREFCNNFIKQSQTYKACSRVPSVSPDSLIENCVLDIMMTNSTIWAAGSREALRTTCTKELSQNTTLKEVTEEGKPSIAEQVKKIACTNECSGHGICINGTCKCDEDFGAKDCSMDMNKPPVVYGVNIEEGGLCDKRTCQKALVEGYGFLDMDTLKCLLTGFHVTENKTVVGDVMEHMVQAEHDSIAEVFCPLGPARRRRSVPRGFVQGITLSVANNGRNFSTHHTIYVLDGVCQDTVNVSGDIQFTLRVGYCYISGKCYGDGSIHETEECVACNTEKSTTEWSKVDGCGVVTEAVDDKLEVKGNLKPEGGSFPTTIVITVLVSGLVLAALVTSVVLYYKMKRSAR